MKLFLSRIAFRLFAFNILLIFLPIAGFLYLNTYEEQLLKALEHSLVQQGRVLASALSVDSLDEAGRILEGMQQRLEARIRIVDARGMLLADSSRLVIEGLEGQNPAESTSEEEIPDGGESVDDQVDDDPETRRNLLYRIAVFPVTLYRRFLQPPGIPLESGDFYSGQDRLLGSEVRDALAGRYGAATRISSGGQRSVTLYSAIPVRQGDTVSGAVLVSQSTYRILKDLYELRLQVFRIFLISLAAAIVLSLLLSMTISRPVRRLSTRAEKLLDRRGRLRGSFPATRRRDEIGDLSRSLSDLTARLESHLQFIESFASDVSHEFKNPLASIRSATETLAGTEDEVQRARFINIVTEEVARLEHLLNGVREITRIDARLDDENREQIDLIELTRRIIDAYSRRINDGAVRFEMELPSGTEAVFVSATAERLAQVLENLLDNAAGFSPPGGNITVTVGRKGIQPAGKAVASLQVADEGPGIPEEDLERIFDRFVSNRPDKGDHMGLGLSIVKAIVEGYGGTVRASNRETGGTRITVLLPPQDAIHRV